MTDTRTQHMTRADSRNALAGLVDAAIEGDAELDRQHRDYLDRVAHAHRTRDACACCGRALAIDALVVRVAFDRPHMTLFDGVRWRRWREAPVSLDCYRAGLDSAHAHVAVGALDGRLVDAPCAGCRRTVRVFTDGRRRFAVCSERCRSRAWRHLRRGRQSTSCAECADTFTPARSDAAYCSPACRQRAYRRRKDTP